MKKLFLFLFIFCLSSTVSSAPKHLEDLRELEENISPEDNSYAHRHIVVTWKGSNGSTRYVSHTYCSGLIEALLAHSYGYDSNEIQKWFHRSHPRAEDFYDAIVAHKGFDRITDVNDMQPGDIIALKYPKGAYFERGDSTGHVMIVDKVPELMENSSPFVNHTKQWRVNVIDSSKTGHGRSDTRYVKRGTYEKGLGKGIFRIYTNDSNRILGYSWSISKKSDYYPKSERSIAVGRLIPHYEP